MNNLQPIENNNQRVLTTAQIAEQYGTTADRISKNFSANKERYTEGKHYYCLTGNDLKVFKDDFLNSELVKPNASSLYLWTEKGALLHAKSLNTDKAWQAYEVLVDTYFNVQQVKDTFSDLSPQLQYLIQMEQRQKQLEARQQEIENKLEHMQEDRKELIKATLDFGHISYSQQKSIAKAAKLRAIQCCYTAQAYDKIGKRVIFSIYNALQEKFHVASYRDLCMNQMVDALAFIEMWEPDLKLMNDIVHASPKPNLSLFES